MPVTLAQAQVNAATDVDYNVIDMFRRNSWLLDQLVFDDTVTPGTGGGSLSYGYSRLITAAPAGFRRYNEEFTAGQATRQAYSVNLKPFGGAFTLDRDLADLGQAATNELMFQLTQTITSAQIGFVQALLYGDSATNDAAFDGLNKALTGSSTEKTAGYLCGSADWKPSTVNTEDVAYQRIDEIDDWLSGVIPSRTGSAQPGDPNGLPPGVKAIIGNTKAIARLKAILRKASQFSQTADSLGREISMYGQWALVDIGDVVSGSTATPIVPISSNATDLYAVTFGLDAVHGASKAGVPLMRTWLPDFTTTGAVKSGEVQIGPAALVVKSTRAAAVLRGITVQ